MKSSVVFNYDKTREKIKKYINETEKHETEDEKKKVEQLFDLKNTAFDKERVFFEKKYKNNLATVYWWVLPIASIIWVALLILSKKEICDGGWFFWLCFVLFIVFAIAMCCLFKDFGILRAYNYLLSYPERMYDNYMFEKSAQVKSRVEEI
jgi:hypothetical protein